MGVDEVRSTRAYRIKTFRLETSRNRDAVSKPRAPAGVPARQARKAGLMDNQTAGIPGDTLFTT